VRSLPAVAIDTWLATRPSAALGTIVQIWFERLRQCGDDCWS
jgi:hypothetical protein